MAEMVSTGTDIWREEGGGATAAVKESEASRVVCAAMDRAKGD